MCLPILEGIDHAWIFLPPPVFELFIACAAETWVFSGSVWQEEGEREILSLEGASWCPHCCLAVTPCVSRFWGYSESLHSWFCCAIPIKSRFSSHFSEVTCTFSGKVGQSWLFHHWRKPFVLLVARETQLKPQCSVHRGGGFGKTTWLCCWQLKIGTCSLRGNGSCVAFEQGLWGCVSLCVCPRGDVLAQSPARVSPGVWHPWHQSWAAAVPVWAWLCRAWTTNSCLPEKGRKLLVWYSQPSKTEEGFFYHLSGWSLQCIHLH